MAMGIMIKTTYTTILIEHIVILLYVLIVGQVVL